MTASTREYAVPLASTVVTSGILTATLGTFTPNLDSTAVVTLTCVSNLRNNGAAGEIEFHVSTSHDTGTTNAVGYTIEPNSAATAATWVGASRIGSLITDSSGGDLLISIIPTRALRGGGTINVTPSENIWVTGGAIQCSVNGISGSAQVSTIAPYQLIVSLSSSSPVITTQISIRCSTNLALNGAPGSITFSFWTSVDLDVQRQLPGYIVLSKPPKPVPIPSDFVVPVLSAIFDQGSSCGSCYAVASALAQSSRINLIGLWGLGWSNFTQEGCGKCLPAGKTCSDVCTEDSDQGSFGWCAYPDKAPEPAVEIAAGDPYSCCACSGPGLGDQIISPGALIECNKLKSYWTPSKSQFSQLGEDWHKSRLGGCDGGIPVLMMELLQTRGAGESLHVLVLHDHTHMLLCMQVRVTKPQDAAPVIITLLSLPRLTRVSGRLHTIPCYSEAAFWSWHWSLHGPARVIFFGWFLWIVWQHRIRSLLPLPALIWLGQMPRGELQRWYSDLSLLQSAAHLLQHIRIALWEC